MPTLHLTLTDGFTGEVVSVRVSGDTIFREEIHTKMLLGFAAEVEVEVEPGENEVVVEADSAPVLRFLVMVGTEDLYVRLWREGKHLLYEMEKNPPAFL